MKYNVGDKVKFLNDVGSGTIARIEGDMLAYVLTDDGFEIPYPISELLLVEKSSQEVVREIVDKKDNGEMPVDETIPSSDDEEEDDSIEDFVISSDDDNDESETNAEECINIALVHANQNDRFNSNIDVYMINDSSYHVLYNVSGDGEKGRKFIQAGILEPDVKVLILGLKQKEIQNEVRYIFQLLLFRKGIYEYIPPVEEVINFSKSTLVQEKFNDENPYFNEPAQVIELFRKMNFEAHINGLSDDTFHKLIKAKEIKPPVNNNNIKGLEIEEVDLHIHEIVDDYKGLSNGEILNIQMDRFHTTLEGAILHKTKKIVFIHGVGNGKLKYELRKALDSMYPDLKYQDASFREYGFGATMVIIKQ